MSYTPTHPDGFEYCAVNYIHPALGTEDGTYGSFLLLRRKDSGVTIEVALQRVADDYKRYLVEQKAVPEWDMNWGDVLDAPDEILEAHGLRRVTLLGLKQHYVALDEAVIRREEVQQALG